MAYQKGWLEDASGNQIAASTLASEVVMNNWDSTPSASNVETLLNALHTDKADLASPTFTGTPAAPTASVGTNTTQIATTAFVAAEINSKIVAAQAMVFKGTIGTSPATVQALPATHNVGDTYSVATAGTYAGEACEVGDLILCLTAGTSANDAHWTVQQKNIDGAVVGPASSVDANVAVFDSTTGKLIKDSGKALGVSIATPASGDASAGKFLLADGSWAVPTDTDTHYSADLVVGASASATADASTTNSTTFVNTVENSGVSGSFQIEGSGSVEVSAANGKITVAGTDTVGIPVVESNGSAPSNLASGGIFFRKAASA